MAIVSFLAIEKDMLSIIKPPVLYEKDTFLKSISPNISESISPELSSFC